MAHIERIYRWDVHCNTLTRQQNFRLVQIQRVCRRQINAHSEGKDLSHRNVMCERENAGYQHSFSIPLAHLSMNCDIVIIHPLRVQRFPEKALVLLDKSLPKDTHPALISPCPSSDQFKLKKSQKTEIPFIRFW